jgi:hypothetical protein
MQQKVLSSQDTPEPKHGCILQGLQEPKGAGKGFPWHYMLSGYLVKGATRTGTGVTILSVTLGTARKVDHH